MTDNVSLRLENLAKLKAERAAEHHGDTYLRFGRVLWALFPGGVRLRTIEEFGRFAVFVQVAHKVARAANSIDRAESDSLNDLSVYAQMLQEYNATYARDFDPDCLPSRDWISDALNQKGGESHEK